ncbi:MAG: hypothetical protein DMG57_24870 [Acidobacteria bacterium]|nr:MAG: hypothetical protein DMG57_24870 [Acidobacteriota bacterium]
MSSFGLVTSILACIAFAQKSKPSASNLLESLPGTPFEWEAVPEISERSSLNVPVTLADSTYKYQFDTGADVTIIYGGEAARKFGWRKGRRVVRFPGIGLGGIMLPASNVVVNDQEVEPGGTAGTIGLDVLIGHVVVLDFPAKRIYVALRADLPAAVWDRTVWTPAEIRGGKFFVHLKLNGADYKDLFLDTGSSAFPLIVDTGQWKTLTQTVDDNHPPKEITASSWGKKVKFVGAPALGAIEIASLSLDHPMIFHTPADPNGFHSQPHGAYGLLGNALFWNDILVLDFSITPQLGILR